MSQNVQSYTNTFDPVYWEQECIDDGVRLLQLSITALRILTEAEIVTEHNFIAGYVYVFEELGM